MTTPAYIIDILFLLLAPLHPSLMVIALIQYIARRSAFVCRGFATFGVVQQIPEWLRLVLLPGLADEVMSNDGSEDQRTGSEPAEPEAVRAHQNQIEPGSSDENEPAIMVSSLRNMSDEELITLLAVLRKNGAYRFSANKILEIVGGTAADVKAQVAALRPANESPQRKKTNSLHRPQNGW